MDNIPFKRYLTTMTTSIYIHIQTHHTTHNVYMLHETATQVAKVHVHDIYNVHVYMHNK